MVNIAGPDGEERALIARIAANDRAAFETFYHAFVRRVFVFVHGIVGARDLAEEITGDTMVEVWRGAQRYSGRARVSTWVFAIAHHRALSTLRRKHLNVVSLDAAPPVGVWDDASRGPLGDDSAPLATALATLSPQHRAVLELTYTFDCTQAEIATIVNAPLATVKTRVFNAKRRLRAALERPPVREQG